MYVCPEATGHSFRAIDLKFGTQHRSPLRPAKKKEKKRKKKGTLVEKKGKKKEN